MFTKMLTKLSLGVLLGLSFTAVPQANRPDPSTNQNPLECMLCTEVFTRNIPIIQLDCPNGAGHHGCLSCIYRLHQTRNANLPEYRRNPNHKAPCPMCRSIFTIHDPCIVPDNYEMVHHVNRRLSVENQQKLRELIQFYGRSPQSMPDTPLRFCQGCNNDVPANNLYIQYACQHGACLEHAVTDAQSASHSCPQCQGNRPLRIIDPIDHSQNGAMQALYHNRPLTQQEVQRLTTLQAQNSILVLDRQSIIGTIGNAADQDDNTAPENKKIGFQNLGSPWAYLFVGTTLGAFLSRQAHCSFVDTDEDNNQTTLNRISLIPLSLVTLKIATSNTQTKLINKICGIGGFLGGIALYAFIRSRYDSDNDKTDIPQFNQVRVQ